MLECNLQSLNAECNDVKNQYEVLRVHENNQKFEFDRLRKDYEVLMDKNSKTNNDNTKLSSDLSVQGVVNENLKKELNETRT